MACFFRIIVIDCVNLTFSVFLFLVGVLGCLFCFLGGFCGCVFGFVWWVWVSVWLAWILLVIQTIIWRESLGFCVVGVDLWGGVFWGDVWFFGVLFLGGGVFLLCEGLWFGFSFFGVLFF